jgi:hypothetical protein
MPPWVGNYVDQVVSTSSDAATIFQNGSTWQTRDGGATWHQEWPALRGERLIGS